MTTKSTKPGETIKVAVANNVLLEVPIWEAHFRGSNWMAVINVDGSSPGGLSRRFMPRGKGDCFYLLEQLQLFDPIEFGADYTTSVGTKKRDRWYGVVTAVTDGHLSIERTSTGVAAVLRAKEARESPRDRAMALRETLQAHLDQVVAIEREIHELDRTPVESEVPADLPTVPFSVEDYQAPAVPPTAEQLADLFSEVERTKDCVVRVWVSPTSVRALKSLPGFTLCSSLTPEVFGSLWGATFLVSPKIPHGRVYLTPGKLEDADLVPEWTPVPEELQSWG